MNMYVFERVLPNYFFGMVVIAAEDLLEAQMIASQEFNWRKDITLADFLEYQPGFKTADGVYPLVSGGIKGVLHSVYGGG